MSGSSKNVRRVKDLVGQFSNVMNSDEMMG